MYSKPKTGKTQVFILLLVCIPGRTEFDEYYASDSLSHNMPVDIKYDVSVGLYVSLPILDGT